MKNRKLFGLFAAEALVLLLCIVNLFRDRTDLVMDASFFQGGGVYDESRGGWYIDQTFGANEVFLLSGPLSIPAGVYKVELSYETDTDMVNRCTVVDETAALGGIRTNGDHLYAGLGSTDYEVWVSDGNGSLQIQVSYGGAGYLLVKGVRIYDGGAMGRMVFFMALLLFAGLDFMIWYRRKNAGAEVSAEKKLVAAGLLLTIAASSYPLMTDYVISAGDMVFHLLRIEGVKDALLAGQFPVRIAPNWQQGYGYASSVFYGDTMLFIPAVLRLTGFSIQTSYKAFLLLLNIGTCLISYYSFWKVCGNRWIGMMCGMMYTMSVYRFFKMYFTGGLGEAISIMFIPLLVAGFYKIFTEDVGSRGYRRNWILPVIGFCGLLQSHVLSTYIVSGFVVLLCILMWRKVFRRETFLVLAYIVVITGLLSAWFIVPFLDYMSQGTFVINHVSGRRIQNRGLHIAQLFKFFFNAGNNNYYYDAGLISAEPAGLGGVLVVGAGLFMLLAWIRKTDNLDKKMLGAGKTALFLGACALAMSTYHFPWDRIQRFSGLTASLTSSLQFPSRFLGVGTAALVLVAGIAGVCVWNMGKPLWKTWYLFGMSGLALLGGTYLLNDICDSPAGTAWHLYNVGGIGTGYISGAEYLPVGTDPQNLTYRAPSAGQDVEMDGYDKRYLTVDFRCVNGSAKEGYVDVPMLYYKGYRARAEDGKELDVCPGENNVVRVLLPGGFEGKVSVRFVSPWYWRLAEGISAFTLAGLAMYGIRVRRSGRHGA